MPAIGTAKAKAKPTVVEDEAAESPEDESPEGPEDAASEDDPRELTPDIQAAHDKMLRARKMVGA